MREVWPRGFGIEANFFVLMAVGAIYRASCVAVPKLICGGRREQGARAVVEASGA